MQTAQAKAVANNHTHIKTHPLVWPHPFLAWPIKTACYGPVEIRTLVVPSMKAGLKFAINSTWAQTCMHNEHCSDATWWWSKSTMSTYSQIEVFSCLSWWEIHSSIVPFCTARFLVTEVVQESESKATTIKSIISQQFFQTFHARAFFINV